jgi:hypothetical protein
MTARTAAQKKVRLVAAEIFAFVFLLSLFVTPILYYNIYDSLDF